VDGRGNQETRTDRPSRRRGRSKSSGRFAIHEEKLGMRGFWWFRQGDRYVLIGAVPISARASGSPRHRRDWARVWAKLRWLPGVDDRNPRPWHSAPSSRARIHARARGKRSDSSRTCGLPAAAPAEKQGLCAKAEPARMRPRSHRRCTCARTSVRSGPRHGSNARAARSCRYSSMGQVAQDGVHLGVHEPTPERAAADGVDPSAKR